MGWLTFIPDVLVGRPCVPAEVVRVHAKVLPAVEGVRFGVARHDPVPDAQLKPAAGARLSDLHEGVSGRSASGG